MRIDIGMNLASAFVIHIHLRQCFTWSFMSRAVFNHTALVSDDLCQCRSHSRSASTLGFAVLRRISGTVSNDTWNAAPEG